VRVAASVGRARLPHVRAARKLAETNPLTEIETSSSPERPATRRLEAALVRLEAAATRAAAKAAAARELDAAATEALAALDQVLEARGG